MRIISKQATLFQFQAILDQEQDQNQEGRKDSSTHPTNHEAEVGRKMTNATSIAEAHKRGTTKKNKNVQTFLVSANISHVSAPLPDASALLCS
jgi:hypothetical protein